MSVGFRVTAIVLAMTVAAPWLPGRLPQELRAVGGGAATQLADGAKAGGLAAILPKEKQPTDGWCQRLRWDPGSPVGGAMCVAEAVGPGVVLTHKSTVRPCGEDVPLLALHCQLTI